MAKAASPAYRRLAEDERRRLLIEATIAVLADVGLSGTTVRRIAAEAGVTPGLVTHYFAGKDALVSSAYRTLAEQYHRDYVAASEAAGPDALDRLRTFVSSAFQPQTLDRHLLRVWTSFWVSALTDPDSEPARVHYETAQESRSYLKRLLDDVLVAAGRAPTEREIDDLAIGIGSLVDGMWLTWGLDPELFDADDGRRIALEFVAARLGITDLARVRRGPSGEAGR